MYLSGIALKCWIQNLNFKNCMALLTEKVVVRKQT